MINNDRIRVWHSIWIDNSWPMWCIRLVVTSFLRCDCFLFTETIPSTCTSVLLLLLWIERRCLFLFASAFVCIVLFSAAPVYGVIENRPCVLFSICVSTSTVVELFHSVCLCFFVAHLFTDFLVTRYCVFFCDLFVPFCWSVFLLWLLLFISFFFCFHFVSSFRSSFGQSTGNAIWIWNKRQQVPSQTNSNVNNKI